MVNGSTGRPCVMARATKSRIVRRKFAKGPAATVSTRAQSGAPSMVWRRSGAGALSSAPPMEAALASPRNFT